jgi:hypothetical protein
MLPRLLKQMKNLLMQPPREQPSPVKPLLEMQQPLEFCSQQQKQKPLEQPSLKLEMLMLGRATQELMKLNLRN